MPEVLDAVHDLADAEELAPGAAELRAGVGPQLARGAKDLRVFCDMARARRPSARAG